MFRELRRLLRMVWRMGVNDRPVRPQWWRTMLGVAWQNPRALRYVGAMAALYLHLGRRRSPPVRRLAPPEPSPYFY
jgi:hypothetical protein